MKNQTIKAVSKSDFHVKQLKNPVRKLAKHGNSGVAIELPDKLEHSGKIYSVDAKLRQWIETGQAKKVVKFIKEMKVQA